VIFSWFNTKEVREFGRALAQSMMDEIPADARVKDTKFAAKATSSDAPDARELQMTLRMADWQAPKTLQDSLAKDKRFTVKLGPSRKTPDPKYGYTGDVSIVIPPEKPKPAAKAPAKPADANGAATQPAQEPSAPASQPAAEPAAPTQQPAEEPA
jgi:hypothetical protein